LDNIELQAKTRTATGNGPARVLRREGQIPAILYGPGTEPEMLSIGARDLENIIKEQGAVGRAIFNLTIDGGTKAKAAMIKELQTHPVSRDILHIDFYAVAMDRKVNVNIPIVTTGKSVGVELGGMLQIIRRELEVSCLPDAIPEEITIDITDLDVGNSVHVEDISLEGDVEIPHEVNFTILTVVAPTKAEEEEVVEEDEELAEGEEAAEEAEEGAEE
jgi:large subunit ribosomal protein L25